MEAFPNNWVPRVFALMLAFGILFVLNWIGDTDRMREIAIAFLLSLLWYWFGYKDGRDA